jgi:dihydrofolate reductase
MRKVAAGLAITLDGVVEAPSSGWLTFSPEMGQQITEGVQHADAILLGTRTYAEFARLWPRQVSGGAMADWMNTTHKYVFSSTLERLDWGPATLVSSTPAELIGELRAQPGKTIQVPGSPRLVRSLLREGLLDELSLMIHPLVLGSGLRLFDELTERIPLAVTGSVTFPNGVISVIYDVSRE